MEGFPSDLQSNDLPSSSRGNLVKAKKLKPMKKPQLVLHWQA
jgi:hypothetical protein